MAILTKDRAGTLRYVLPSGSVPSSIKVSLYDPTDTALAIDQVVTAPTSYAAASAMSGTRAEEVIVTLSVAPTGIKVGEIVRVFNTWGQEFDCLCYGKDATAKKVRLADCACDPTEVASVYNPVLSIPVSASYLDDTGDGWKAILAIVQGGETRYHTLWFSVAILSLQLAISPREFLNQNPHLTKDLAALELRKDWPLLVLEAAERVEERLRSRDRWYSLVISDTGLRRCMMGALGVLLAGTSVPDGVDFLAWRADAEEKFNMAVSEVLAGGYYDVDQSGVADEDEKAPPIQTSYKVL